MKTRAGTKLHRRTVAIYAQKDRLSTLRHKADEAYQVGPGEGPIAAYPDIESIVNTSARNNPDRLRFCRER
jgi:pyruvate carboxylase